jgi:cyclomaltodextrinase / maltogenic alpha-amylase / neopullulanase
MDTNNFNNLHIYHIYPLGFTGAPKTNTFQSTPEFRLGKVYQWVEHLKSLHINAIYFGPIWESTSHGYDTADFYNIDRRLGTNDDVKELFAVLQQNGIKIILDGVFNHVSRDFWAFRDVRENGAASPYCNWFAELNFNAQSPFGDPFSYQGWNNHYSLVKLNLQNHDCVQHLLGAVTSWIQDFNIDGIRLDAADCVDIQFQQKLAAHVQSLKPGFFLLGEIIHGDYKKWANENTLHSVTNYECYKGLHSSINDKNMFEIAYSLNRQFGSTGLYKGLPLYSFTDNHDVNRLASQLKDYRNIALVYCLMYTIPGIPSIYYGSEFGIRGERTPGSDSDLRPELHLGDLYANHDVSLLERIKLFATLREQLHSLMYGNYRQLEVKNEQFAFIRESGKDFVVVIVNSSDNDCNFDARKWKLPVDSLTDALSGKKESTSGNINVHGHDYRVLYNRD